MSHFIWKHGLTSATTKRYVAEGAVVKLRFDRTYAWSARVTTIHGWASSAGCESWRPAAIDACELWLRKQIAKLEARQ